MIYFLLSVSEVAPYALQLIKQLASPYHIKTLVDLLKYAKPQHKLTILKVLKKLQESKIPSEIFDQSINETKQLTDTQESLFTQNIGNSFAKFLYDYALQIRTTPTDYEQENMFAVSKQLLQVMQSFVSQEEIVKALEISFSSIEKFCTEEKNLLFELLGSSFRSICKGDKI